MSGSLRSLVVVAVSCALSTLFIGSTDRNDSPYRSSTASRAALAPAGPSSPVALAPSPVRADAARPERAVAAAYAGQARPMTVPMAAGGTNAPQAHEIMTDQGPVAVVADEVLVALRPGTGAEELAALAKRHGMTVRSHSEALGMARLGVPGEIALEAAIASVQREAIVADARGNALMQGAGMVPVTLDGAVHLLEGDTTSKRLELVASDRSRHEAVYRDLQWNLRQLDVPSVVDAGMGGEAMTVAVLDTGVAYETRADASGTYVQAPDLAHVTFVSPRDVVHGDDHANDDHGHGTEMTSLMSGIGAAYPIAPNLNIMPVKVLDSSNSGTEAWLVEGIAWAIDHGADVINLSLVFPEAYRPSPMLQAAINAADEAGIVVVAATGNSGGSFVPYPAAFPSVLAVGAYRPTDLSNDLATAGVRASYSNSSALVDVLAPGGSHTDDVDRNGLPDALVAQSFSQGDPTDIGYFLVSGTSPAAAQTSAVVALLLAAGDSPEDVRTRLHQTATKTGVSGGFDAVSGSGRVNAGAAVDAALNADISEACRAAQVFANPVGAIVEPTAGRRMARFQVEIVDADLTPVSGATVYGRISGSSSHQLTATTDRDGIATFVSAQVSANGSAGVNWSLEVEAVLAAQGGCAKGARVLRPAIFSRVEELSYRLLSSFGAGMASSSLIALLDPTAAATLRDVTTMNYQLTYMQRAFGAGMASSSLVAIFDGAYLLSHATMQSAVILRTYGSGMASSSIIFDQSFFNPALLSSYNTLRVAAMGYTLGQGMASSSIIVGGIRYAWDAYLPLSSAVRGVIWLTNGSGMASSSLVLDRGVLNPALLLANTANLQVQLASRSVTTTTIGTAQAATSLPLTSSVTSQLGYDLTQLASVQPRAIEPTNGGTAPRWAVGSPYGSGALVASAAATRFGGTTAPVPGTQRSELD